MPRLRPRPQRVLVVPCDRHAGCFRYVVSSTDGLCRERSAYAYASAVCARLTAEVRPREIDGRV